MSLDTFEAVKEGYSDRLFDYQLMCVQSGFWSGYYNNSKHPKSLNSIMDVLIKNKFKKGHKNLQHADEVDVEAFLALEQRRKEFLDGKSD